MFLRSCLQKVDTWFDLDVKKLDGTGKEGETSLGFVGPPGSVATMRALVL